MTDLKDYFVTGVTIGMAINNATKIVINSTDTTNMSNNEISKAICLMTISLLENMCEHDFVLKKEKVIK